MTHNTNVINVLLLGESCKCKTLTNVEVVENIKLS